MTPERWSEIEKLYHAAQERNPSERSAFIAEVCRGDDELRHQIESLLEFEQKTDGFIEVSALYIAAKQLSQPADRLIDGNLVGRTIAHYRLLDELGSGGMGVVYKALDPTLDRFVALKMLRPTFALDSDRLSLLKREARAASALNHPNVVTIYEVGQIGSSPYIAMEWVEGKTLRQMLSSGALPMPNIFEIAEQLASALAKVHAAGLIHRDLKPENVMITQDGLAKVLDFGLAKLVGSDATPKETRSGSSASRLSYLAGTVAYMAPERMLGQADAKADQFSLGCILYEMAAGTPAFGCDNREGPLPVADQEVVPLDKIRADAPPAFCRIVGRCLEKTPSERYPSTADLLQEIRRVRIAPREFSLPAKVLSKRKRLLAAFTVILILVTAIALSLSAIRGWFKGSAAAPVRSLAVLPLENLSHVEDDEYFADGMTEELITEIGQTMSQRLKVISRDTVMRYKRTQKSLTQIADELKVDAVLEGSVLLSGENVRITEKLIGAGSQEVLWTNSYEGSTQDVLQMQRRAARDIAQQINIKLTPDKQTELASVAKIDAKAHQDYLAGLYHFNNRYHSGAEGLEKSVQFFSQVIERQSNYAPAYAALANSYLVLGFFGALAPSDAYRAAKENALKSLSLDPNGAEAHAALGRVLTSYEWNWAGAEAEFKRAIQLNSNYALTSAYYAILLAVTGRANEAVATAQHALDQDELSLSLNSGRAWMSYLARRYDESIQGYQRALEIDPASPQEIEGLAEAYEMAGRVPEAFEQYQTWAKMGGMSARQIALLERAYRKGGMKGYWQRRLDMEIQDEQSGDVWSYVMASLYARVGNKEQTLRWLEKAYYEHHDRLILLNVDPVFDSVRSDARFQDLVRRVGLPL